MTMTMYEKIAKAIWDRSHAHDQFSGPWEAAGHAAKVPSYQLALAALQAMEQPTEDMREAMTHLEEGAAYAAAIELALSQAR